MFSPPVGTIAHFSTKGPATSHPMGLSPGTSPFGFILLLLFFTVLPYICIPKQFTVLVLHVFGHYVKGVCVVTFYSLL